MIHGKLKCPNCNQELELSATKAPAQQSRGTSSESNGESQKVDIRDLLASIDESSLDGKNADFVAQLKEKAAKYRGFVFMSPKQMGWLNKLAGVADEWE